MPLCDHEVVWASALSVSFVSQIQGERSLNSLEGALEEAKRAAAHEIEDLKSQVSSLRGALVRLSHLLPPPTPPPTHTTPCLYPPPSNSGIYHPIHLPICLRVTRPSSHPSIYFTLCTHSHLCTFMFDKGGLASAVYVYRFRFSAWLRVPFLCPLMSHITVSVCVRVPSALRGLSRVFLRDAGDAARREGGAAGTFSPFTPLVQSCLLAFGAARESLEVDWRP